METVKQPALESSMFIEECLSLVREGMFLRDSIAKTYAGYTDLPSRLPTQSSTLYSNNITKFLLSLGQNKEFSINLEDEVVRGSIVIHQGEVLQPIPRLMPAPTTPAPTPKAEATPEVLAITPWQKASREVAVVTSGMGGAIALGKAAGTAFMDNFFTFGLAGLIGYRSVSVMLRDWTQVHNAVF